MLEETKNKLEWIKKRVPLNDMQEEYVGFIMNEQEKMIALLSGHIYATRAHMAMPNNIPEAINLLTDAIADIERNKKIKSEHTVNQCRFYDEAQGKNFCTNPRILGHGKKKSCKGVCIYFEEKHI